MYQRLKDKSCHVLWPVFPGEFDSDRFIMIAVNFLFLSLKVMDIVEEEVGEWRRRRRCYAMSDRLQVSPRQPDLASQQTKGRRLGCWLAWPGLAW